MRTKVFVTTFALLLASGGLAFAQEPSQAPPPGQGDGQGQAAPGSQAQQGQTQQGQPAQGQEPSEAFDPLAGSPLVLDVGFRVSSVNGDRARFERFQDIRSAGLNVNLFGSKEGDRWAADYSAKNVGYHDQQYGVSFSGMGKVFANFSFFQLPLNYGFADDGFLKTPYDSNLSLDAATRAAAQANRVLAWTANPTQSSAWLPLAHAIDLASRRDQLDAALVYSPTRTVDLNIGVTSYKKTGDQPWSASWGFSNAVELPAPLDNRTTNFTIGAAYTIDQLGVQLAFDNSRFDNNNDIMNFDNPAAATDSLAKGAARGVMSIMPSNSMTTFRGSGVYKLPSHTTVSAAFAVSRFDQDSDLPPITSNSLLNAGAPDRATAQAKADVGMFNLVFNSRPIPKLWLTGRYRYRNFTQKTPPYLSNVTIFDTSITTEDSTEPSEYLDFKTQNLQLGASYAVVQYATLRFDYVRNAVDQTIREWPTVDENTERVSVDSVGSQWASLHASYEHSTRRGSGEFDLPDGQQPATRMFDVADRTRNAGKIMLVVTPTPMVGINFSLNAGKDNYDDPGQQFGLLDNKNQVFTVGVDATPNEYVTAGVAYGFEKYTAVSASRNANPPPDPSFTDPNRNWFDNHEEHVHTLTANLMVTHVVPNAEVLFGYDYSHSNQSYLYSGPNILRLQSLPPAAYAIGFAGQFSQLPNVLNAISRATVNLKYFFTSRLAANITYWYDKYSVNDFATPTRIDSPGAILLGYGWRPYTANTVFFNALYRF